jgi:hypothetical protein
MRPLRPAAARGARTVHPAPHARAVRVIRRVAPAAERCERDVLDNEVDAGSEEQCLIVKVPVKVAAILRALEKEAMEGIPQAGRELRAWLEKYPPQDERVRIEDLSAERRRKILARLNAEIEAEKAALASAESAPLSS